MFRVDFRFTWPLRPLADFRCSFLFAPSSDTQGQLVGTIEVHYSQTCIKRTSINLSLTKVPEIISLNYSKTDLHKRWPVLSGRGHLFRGLNKLFLLSSPLLNGDFEKTYHTSATSRTVYGSDFLQFWFGF